MYLSFSRYCRLQFCCKILECVFSEVVISGSSSDSIINYYNFRCLEELIEKLLLATEIGIVTFSCGTSSELLVAWQ